MQLRAAGTADACQRAGLDAPQTNLGKDHSVQGCAVLAQEVLDTADRPSAIVATSDIAAIGTLHAARILGIAIPQELSVTGFDDTPMAAYVFPAITTVAQPIDLIAHECIAALLSMIKAPTEADPNGVILPVALKVRQSTATAS